MLRCILWGTGWFFAQNVNYIKKYETKGIIKVLAVTSKECPESSALFGYSWKGKNEIKELEPDVIILMTNRMLYKEICKEAEGLGIGAEKVVLCEMLYKPYFNLKRYLQLKQNPPTILVGFCWGGATCNSLGLPFCSPWINIWVPPEDFIKFLKRPQHYMEQPILLEKYEWGPAYQADYPVCTCDDIHLFCWHDKDYETVKANWERRKQRIKWDNLLVLFVTENEQHILDFKELPYEKKVCFVPFKTEEKDVYTLEVPEGYAHIFDYVNAMASEKVFYYDALELLCSGKVKLLEEYT